MVVHRWTGASEPGAWRKRRDLERMSVTWRTGKISMRHDKTQGTDECQRLRKNCTFRPGQPPIIPPICKISLRGCEWKSVQETKISYPAEWAFQRLRPAAQVNYLVPAQTASPIIPTSSSVWRGLDRPPDASRCPRRPRPPYVLPAEQIRYSRVPIITRATTPTDPPNNSDSPGAAFSMCAPTFARRVAWHCVAPSSVAAAAIKPATSVSNSHPRRSTLPECPPRYVSRTAFQFHSSPLVALSTV
ncbi:hypothetical protein B0H14DRAFT_845522 [Mycena olivaceomarginata]|nr:hypothetical protein B0H14DRAFT_845522 [Mycena olivaceomarginata]